MKNLYESLDNLKADLGVTATSNDAVFLRYLDAASRAVDDYCKRHFYVEMATKYKDSKSCSRLLLNDDLLVATTLTTDSELDGTYDGETWTENTDFWLGPDNKWPKRWITITEFGNYSFSTTPRNIKIIGEWGYGDGEGATPYTATTITGTVADATTVTLTASSDASAIVYPGNTLLTGTEQMYVSAVATTAITVVRGVNGTTAAAQSAAAINIYDYPSPVVRTVGWLAAHEYKHRKFAGMAQEKIGDYFYTKLTTEMPTVLLRALGTYRRKDVP